MRPIILGTVNPHSADPANALAPRPAGSSGWRLFKMVNSISHISELDYELALDRRNLVARDWSRESGAAAGKKFMRGLKKGDVVVVLGADAWQALGFKNRRPEPGGSIVTGGARLYYLPHPSGRNMYYNDELNCWRAGELIASLIRRAACAA